MDWSALGEVVTPLARVVVFLVGIALVVSTIVSAIRTFVLPRSVRDPLSAAVFRSVRFLFGLRLRFARTFAERDQIMALFAPFGLLTLPAVWLTIVQIGYMAIYWALGAPSWWAAFTLSGSSLLTLGFATVSDVPMTMLAFSEATVGLVLVALLIAYLPTMYSAFSRRETAVTMLEVRAGSPPSAVGLIERYHRLNRLSGLQDLWISWEVWFVEVEETHTSLAALSFFRSPHPERSWVTAAGAILDAAALMLAAVDVPREPEAALCIRAGYLTLRQIASFFRIPFEPDPTRAQVISITRAEFDDAYEQLASAGVPLRPDRDQCWRDFVGWRVNYDTVLLALARLVMAPPAPWSSDRADLAPGHQPPITQPLADQPARRGTRPGNHSRRG